MNKFCKKYVCYDPNLTRFSELGNVALNKAFWERTYATTRKFSHLITGVPSSLAPCPCRGDFLIRNKQLQQSVPKMKTSETSSLTNAIHDLQDNNRTPAKKKPCALGNENAPCKTKKKLKTFVLLPQPDLSSVNPFDEIWPQSTLAATQSLPNVKQLHPSSKESSPQRRVSRLPSLTRIVEQETFQQQQHQEPLIDRCQMKHLENSENPDRALLLSFDAPTPPSRQEFNTKPKLKSRMKHSKERDLKSRDSKSRDSKSRDSKSRDSKSRDSKSRDSKSRDSKSRDSKSRDSKSRGSKSRDLKFRESKSRELRERELRERDLMERDSSSQISVFSTESNLSIMTLTKTTESLKPSEEAAASMSESSVTPSALIAMDRVQFWNERRPKKVPPPICLPGRVCERRKEVCSLVHRHALRHPLRHLKPTNRENSGCFTRPSPSLTNILDAYSSIPILKRVEIYSSLHKQKSIGTNVELTSAKTDYDAITL